MENCHYIFTVKLLQFLSTICYKYIEHTVIVSSNINISNYWNNRLFHMNAVMVNR